MEWSVNGDNIITHCFLLPLVIGILVPGEYPFAGCCGHHQVLTSVGLWKTAQTLFERSSLANSITHITMRLTKVELVILEQHAKQLAELHIF
jgi:hypothetical protein